MSLEPGIIPNGPQGRSRRLAARGRFSTATDEMPQIDHEMPEGGYLHDAFCTIALPIFMHTPQLDTQTKHATIQSSRPTSVLLEDKG
jgi:hypothetical protein